ncbi:ATP-binding cassette domain-containing protein [Nonomuraea jabiensis]|uniref:ABC-type sugar transport system ATPase subunit n=1 Tax=Nonomuraea jabiensis TaxID=882448 RepID=A0A7W9LEH4_9ACTN|nr:sugar ABC transporter ATP-binding protein [Nonomuraea jabiensis]MBB5780867.1 ABC-type sugar transport system ATPase subunit [Nonomuraea jabiensis]
MEPVLEARAVSKRFPGVLALDGVSLALRPGEVHALVGENGAGKSTLIKVFTGVYRPDGGELRYQGDPAVFGTPMEAQRAGISTIYQEVNLVPMMSVARNLLLGREPRGRFGVIDAAAMHGQAQRVLAGYGVATDVRRPLRTLGVGAQQMVALARAVSVDARVVIMDEPTSSLEPREVETLFGVIRRLRDAGIAVMYVSHRLDELYRVCDQVTVLRDGRVAHSGPLAEVERLRLISLMLGRDLNEVRTGGLTRFSRTRHRTTTLAPSPPELAASAGPATLEGSAVARGPATSAAGPAVSARSATPEGQTASEGPAEAARSATALGLAGSEGLVSSAGFAGASADLAASARRAAPSEIAASERPVGSEGPAVASEGPAASLEGPVASSEGSAVASERSAEPAGPATPPVHAASEGAVGVAGSGASVTGGASADPPLESDGLGSDGLGSDGLGSDGLGVVQMGVGVGAPVVEARGLTRRHVLDGVDVAIAPGEVVGLGGLLGAGRTETAKAIVGALPLDGGQVLVAGRPLRKGTKAAIRAGVSLLPEDRKAEGIIPTLSVRENIALAALPSLGTAGVVSDAKIDRVVEIFMRRLRIKAASPHQLVSELSGGNQQKVLLARWLAVRPKVLLLDEPTRGIDVGAKAEVQALIDELAEEGLGVLLISSDLEELVEGADRILVLREGAVVGELSGEEVTEERIMATIAEHPAADQPPVERKTVEQAAVERKTAEQAAVDEAAVGRAGEERGDG